jgi:hypothetical protein
MTSMPFSSDRRAPLYETGILINSPPSAYLCRYLYTRSLELQLARVSSRRPLRSGRARIAGSPMKGSLYRDQRRCRPPPLPMFSFLPSRYLSGLSKGVFQAHARLVSVKHDRAFHNGCFHVSVIPLPRAMLCQVLCLSEALKQIPDINKPAHVPNEKQIINPRITIDRLLLPTCHLL